MSGTFMIVDGTNLLMHSIHAVHHRHTEPAGPALDVFMGMLGRHVREETPTRIAVCWDDTRSWRSETWPAYKATRSSVLDPDARGSAFELTKSFLHLCGVPNAAGFRLEADDVVAAFWRGAQGPAVDQLTILSGDGDFAQLLGVSPHDIPTGQIKPGKNPTRLDMRDVHERWGCWPHQVPAAKALTGDVTDGIPGLKGIGPKKAVKLLGPHDYDLGRALADRPVTEREAASLYLKLVDLRSEGATYRPPPRFVPLPPDHPQLVRAAELVRSYQLERLWSDLVGGDIWSPRQDYSFEVPSDLLAGR